MITYNSLKARKKWISLIKSYKHIDIMSLLWRLKVISQTDRMIFIEETHRVFQESERKKRRDNSLIEERPRWGKPVDIKPTKARR